MKFDPLTMEFTMKAEELIKIIEDAILLTQQYESVDPKFFAVNETSRLIVQCTARQSSQAERFMNNED